MRPEAEELVRSLEERLGQEAWDWRLLPSSCTPESSPSITLSNSLSLLLPLSHLAASCQLLQTFCPSSLMARAGSTSAEAGMEEPVLEQVPATLTSIMSLLQSSLPSAVSLEDCLWASLDSCLPWLRRLLLLSLSPSLGTPPSCSPGGLWSTGAGSTRGFCRPCRRPAAPA